MMNIDESSIKRRQRLSMAVRAMFIMLALAFLFVFFRGLGGTIVTGSESDKENSVTQTLLLGQTSLRRFAGKRVWITRISDAQRLEAATVSAYVFKSDAGCVTTSEFCALNAATGRAGVELSFTEQAPAQVPSHMPWHGGFVNPSNGAVYDRLGRPYKLTLPAPAPLRIIDLN